MQTILVPIDFTASSEHALVYANKLALRLPAEIVLVHSAADGPLTPERRADLLHRLEALAERLRYRQLTRQSGRRINYYYHAGDGLSAEGLQVLVAGFNADLVVAGLALADCAEAQAAGAPRALLPELVSCPVLLVPPGRHELPARVVVSGDFTRLASRHLSPLPGLVRPSGAHFDLVQFYGAGSAGLAPLKKGVLAARSRFAAAAVHLLPAEDELEDLSEFCEQQAAQLLVVATADGCLVRRFFNPHYAKTNAYHLRIPVLVLGTSTEPTASCCAQCSLRKAAEARLIAGPHLEKASAS
ncbi:universal stress protein [Hymenobacter endophyticus]|uniref:Universal stress protein n=1 Tax=Hymenobacter endophyticus TaxID=3076335 RepID=A0ABU3TL04_9BACT|nr:universal stress protein [Hymenobacter endophyticus]MDU0372035.1 universal stress protein [Hymenobacter endophyticus]